MLLILVGNASHAGVQLGVMSMPRLVESKMLVGTVASSSFVCLAVGPLGGGYSLPDSSLTTFLSLLW